jgi:DNA-binding PadR family transcriptional regulator
MKEQTTIAYALLGFVFEQPRHGYEIYQELLARDGLGQVWRIKQSQLYALLAKLEEEGLLSAAVQMQDARPPRKVLALTATGRAAFLTWRQCPVARGRQMRTEFLAKLYFALREGPQPARSLLEAQIATCGAWLAEREPAAPPPMDSAAAGAADRHDYREFFAYSVQQFRLRQIHTFLAWLQVCHQNLSLQTTNP